MKGQDLNSKRKTQEKSDSPFVGNKAKRRISGVSRKQSTPKFPKNKHFLPPDTHSCVCVSGGKKCLFFGNFDGLCFLETPVLRFPFLPYSRRCLVIYSNYLSSPQNFYEKGLMKNMLTFNRALIC